MSVAKVSAKAAYLPRIDIARVKSLPSTVIIKDEAKNKKKMKINNRINSHFSCLEICKIQIYSRKISSEGIIYCYILRTCEISAKIANTCTSANFPELLHFYVTNEEK